MSTPSTETPARRRRHAVLIATAVELTAECALAAVQGVYGPIAAAAPTTGGVPVHRRPFDALAEGAPYRLDSAREDDNERWPGEAAGEDTDQQNTFLRRCATAAADGVLLEVQAPGSGSPGLVPLPSPEQLAMMGPDMVAVDFLEALDSPDDALALMQTAAATEEYTVAQILDAAMHILLTAACLTMRKAASTEDSSMAAETMLMATRSLTQAVMVASMDLA